MKKRYMKVLSLLLLTVVAFSNLAIDIFADVVTFYDQDVTAYTAYPGSLTASGEIPKEGYVAVHPKVWGSHTTPIFPFGAIITTTEELYLPNATDGMTAFVVQDIGDVNNTQGLTKYWFDCYVGEKPDYDDFAEDFGIQTRTYTVRW